MNIENFKSTVRRILKEEIDKRGIMSVQRVPEKKDNEITPHPRETKTKNDLLDEITKLVNDIDKSYTVCWDDHDDIVVQAGDLLRTRIIPKWECNYDIETYINNEDRVYCTNQSWEQVKSFVKKNFASIEDSNLNKSFKKVDDNREDKDNSSHKGLSSEKVKIKKVGDSSNKEKDFNQKAVKNKDDEPDQPMKNVDEFKKQSEHKVKDPVKLRKKHDNPKHVIKH